MARRRRPLTKPGLERAALRYVERFGSTRSRLERAMKRRIERAARDELGDRETLLVALAEIVARFERLGYVDDARYAESKTRSIRARGGSARKVRASLRERGVDAALIDARLEAEEEGTELQAARRLAERRRFGPWRRGEADADARRKELAALGRAGFSYDVAKKALANPEEYD